jgi:hypothetical protein
MPRQGRRPLAERVAEAAERALAQQQHVAPIDILTGIGWLDPGAPQRWRTGRIECLEGAAQVTPPRLTEAMRLFRDWTVGNGLQPSETDHLARTPQRQPLRFSLAGDPATERAYRTHGSRRRRVGRPNWS